MAGFQTFILILYVSAGLFIAAVAVPLIRRKVAPNSLYGFRTPRTLADPGVWYEANAFAGRCFFVGGLVISLTSLALFFVPALDPVNYAFACLVITLLGLAVCLILSFRFLGKIVHHQDTKTQRNPIE